MMILFLILSISTLLPVKGANILALFPLPLYSHTNTFMPVLKELANHGHNITMVSPYPQKQALTNWTDVVINKTPFGQTIDAAVRDFTYKCVYTIIPRFWRLCADLLEIAYEDKALQKLIQDDDLIFDLVITEPLFAHESLVAFGHKLNAPVVGLYPLSLSTWANYVSGNPLSFHLPHFRTAYSDQMTFFERLDNTLINIIELISGIFYYFPKQEKLMEKYMVYPGSTNRPALLDMLKNVSLHLIDYHFSVGYIHPLQPNIIPIGGLSLKGPGDLPKDLKNYMDNSLNGVIYLSFGSHKPVSSLNQKELDAILTTFRKLDVNVLMKWENGTLLNKPDNVELRGWFPQPGILAHPNCRLFITHGGLHSISEAVFHGIPIVGIPFFGDQEFNMKFVERAGFGFSLQKNEINLEKFQHAVESVLYNKSYRENVIRRSLVNKDRLNSALDTAIYWIEYVLRHKDMSHLKPAGINLPLYQVFFCDIILLLFLSVFTLIFSVLIICKTLLKLLFTKNITKYVLKRKTH